MRCIKDKHGNVVQDPVGICETVKEFYKDLYTEEPVDSIIQNELLSNISSILTEDQRKICEGPLTEKELKKAVSQMVNNKSPGLDGLPCVALTSVWMSRNKQVLDNDNVTPDSLFISRLQRRIKNEFLLAKVSILGMYTFTEIWCRNRTLCYIENDTLVLSI